MRRAEQNPKKGGHIQLCDVCDNKIKDHRGAERRIADWAEESGEEELIGKLKVEKRALRGVLEKSGE
jgi:hypothetical protein